MRDRPQAHVSHVTGGRVRFRIPARRLDEAYFAALKQQVGEWPGITQVDVNPLTASVLVFFTEGTDALARAAQSDLFELAEAPPAPSPVPIAVTARRRLEQADIRLREMSGGSTDVRSLAVVGLVAAGASQLLRGNVAAPAVTLLWYATDALRLWRRAAGRDT
jgi:hypothetical protein